MARDYRVALDLEVLDSLPRAGRRREMLLAYFRGLAEYAHLGGDFQFDDPITQRPYEVSIVADYAVTSWIDAPVNNVRVVEIRPAK